VLFLPADQYFIDLTPEKALLARVFVQRCRQLKVSPNLYAWFWDEANTDLVIFLASIG
jgi:hypothetical protein